MIQGLMCTVFRAKSQHRIVPSLWRRKRVRVGFMIYVKANFSDTV